jgi:hypothetical protein
MDYGKVLSRAWEITWRWKVLWILGFLSALGQGGGGSGGSSYSGDGNGWGTFHDVRIPPEVIGLIAGGLCVLLIIAIAIWVISIIARGGLIAGVQQVEEEESTTLGSAWRAGASRFWTLAGIAILAAIPFIILLVAGIIVLAVIFVSSGFALDSFEAGGAMGILFGILCGGVFCCGMIILGIVLNQIRIYAERAAILEGLGWIEAFKRGWEVLKANLGPTIVFWVIFFVIGFALVVLVIGLVMLSVVPFIAIIASTDPGAWLIAPICCGGLLAFIVFALIGAIVETFTSATWTLAYREMTGLAQPVAEPVEEQ